MRFALYASALLVVTACSGADPSPEVQGPTGEAVEQLEAAEMHLADATSDPFQAVSASGASTVTGAERDFSLTVADASGDVTIALHVPGMSDLTSFDGRAVDVELTGAGLHEERAVFVSDDAGPLFIVDDGWHQSEVEALMGQGFASWGETVGERTDEQYDWTYTKGVFQTDDGEVALLPGEAQTIQIDGVSWRVVVIAAYQVNPHPDAALPCGGISDLLSYELLRLDTPAPAAVITRPDNALMAHLGCL